MATSTAGTPTKQRATASGVTVTIGMASVVVDFVPAAVPNKDKASEFHSLCFHCNDPVRLRQALVCPNGHKPITRHQVTRHGKEIGGVLTDVTEDEIAAVRGDDTATAGPKAMNLAVVRTAGLMESTLNGDAVYRLRPNAEKTVPEGYEVLRRLVTRALRSGRAVIGDIAVGGGRPRLYWLSVRNGQVIAQALMRPDDLAPFDAIDDVDVSDKLDSMIAPLIEHLTVDFDPDAYRNQTRERAEQLLAAKAAAGEGTAATVTTLVPRAASSDDLESLVSTMLAS